MSLHPRRFIAAFALLSQLALATQFQTQLQTPTKTQLQTPTNTPLPTSWVSEIKKPLTYNPSIFKAYDIRGLSDLDFDEGFAEQLCAILALQRSSPVAICAILLLAILRPWLRE
jgi:hypothetical protein